MRRIAIVCLLTAGLAGACSQPAQPDGQAQATPDAAASPAAASATPTQAAASAAGKSGAPAGEDEGQDEAAPAAPVRYTCDDGQTAVATYVESGALEQRVNLEVRGQEYGLGLTQAASGARYEAETALPSGKKLVWWTKGDSAMLIEHDPKDANGDNDRIVNCKEAS